ncbi:NirA family protein [Luteolibacter ambystomatis]|uniref:NirA family protein n=1 Tax=Luteolibacter ambystomatis TaxID=2824561 RepID=A0A975J068_9BACT|nr:NirA family protein [Luteolibacter ambystomatis]QUE51599.1 NirA family protein [Luteolibacter ambystomatis]
MSNLPLPTSADFSEDQKAYLTGFFSGVLHRDKVPFLGQLADGRFTHEAGADVTENVHGTPLEDLCREERIKHEKHGLDSYDTILANAGSGEFPRDGDIFRYKFHGLFYVTPAEESIMLRCRVAGGALDGRQFRALANITRDLGNGFLDMTTRANVQVRGILPEGAPEVLMRLSEAGLTSQGAGADNIRNITASPTTGFDPGELIDVLPYARSLHHYILKNRDLYGLPRKFNVAYDSGGAVSVCADTNDIGFQAVRVGANELGVEPGIYFRMQLCGITGHKQFASDSGVLLTPAETLPVAAALIRMFIENGDRTNRNKARLKYLVDEWGIPKSLEETQKKLAFTLRKFPLELCEVPTPKVKHGHLGIHPQSDGRFYIGILMPVGRITVGQAQALADIAEKYGNGDIRLTVWQNAIIPNLREEDLEAVKAAILACGLAWSATSVSGGLVACTGNKGCKYASADTKGHALKLGSYLEQTVALDQPVNIHLTGCPHSCAQHYIGDIGMIAVKVKTADGNSVEGYNIVLGGGTDDTRGIAREIWKGLPYDEIPPLLESLLKVYLATRLDDETFNTFANRHAVEDLKALLGTALPA